MVNSAASKMLDRSPIWKRCPALLKKSAHTSFCTLLLAGTLNTTHSVKPRTCINKFVAQTSKLINVSSSLALLNSQLSDLYKIPYLYKLIQTILDTTLPSLFRLPLFDNHEITKYFQRRSTSPGSIGK